MTNINSLPVLIRTGYYNYPPGWSDDYREYPRPVGSVAYVRRGSAEYFTGDGGFTLNEGDILFISPGSTYLSRWHSGVEMYAVHFILDMAHMSRGPLDGRRYPVQRVDSPEGSLSDIIYIHTHADEADKVMLVFERFYRVMGGVFGRLAYTEGPRVDDRILAAAEYIESHFAEPIPVERLAEISYMSVSHFFSRFKKSFGVTPIEYKRRILVVRAQRLLLEDPKLSITEIADRFGFASETYFRRVFKSITGKSPRDFRTYSGGI